MDTSPHPEEFARPVGASMTPAGGPSQPSKSRLADKLHAARQRRFVGRAAEVHLLRAALDAPELPFSILHLHGPAGVGKTVLLGRWGELCAQMGVPCVQIDGRNSGPTPELFLAALGQVLGINDEAGWLAFGEVPGRRVLIIDTYEQLAPLDDWLRDIFLPQLPAGMLVILSGRDPLPLAWRADPGWQSLVRTLALRNLSPQESVRYLVERGIPAEQHQVVLDFTRGHPLALSLVADVVAQRPNAPFRPEESPDMIKPLLEQFVQQVPGPAHRAALEACALVRLTTESLLGQLLDMPDVHELFEWLRGLSFVESGPLGLFPHDLAREALEADVRWRNPDWYAELRRRARAAYSTRLQQTTALELQGRILAEYSYLHRNNPVVRRFYWQDEEASDEGRIVALPLRQADVPLLLAMVELHEGPESARIAAHWFERQPRGVLVYHEEGPHAEPAAGPLGFMLTVALHQADQADREADPAAQAAWALLQRSAPLRPGEGAAIFRHWMARDSYQFVSPVQSQMIVHIARYCLSTPGLAYTFVTCADPEFWGPLSAYGGLQRLPEADYTTDGRRFGVYGHDWRLVTPLMWLDMLASHEMSDEPPPPIAAEPVVLVLSQEAFAEAVRDALHDFAHGKDLAANPLLRARLVLDRAGQKARSSERVAALKSLLREACEHLRDLPREGKAYRALLNTYIHPLPTQEQAAEALDLPFSTYRRHLKTGILRVTEILWQRELHGEGGEGA